MTPPLTEDQIKEYDRLKKKEADDEKAEKDAREREQRGWIKSGLGWIWDNIIPIGIALFVGFMAYTQLGVDGLKNLWEKTKTFLDEGADKLIDMLPDSWQPFLKKAKGWISGMFGGDIKAVLDGMPYDEFIDNFAEKTGLTKEQLKALIPDQTAQRAIVKLIADANGGVTTDSFTTDKTIYALMTQKPELVQAIASSALAGGKPNANAAKILEPLRVIVNDEKRLGELLTKYEQSTVALIKTLKPEITEKQIAFIKSGVVDGKATPQLRNLMNAMLTPGADGQLPSEAALVDKVSALAQATPGTASAAMDVVREKYPQFAAIIDNNNKVAYKALEAHLGGPTQTQKFFGDFYAQPSDAAKLGFAITNRAALDVYMKAADVKTLPKEVVAVYTALKDIPPEAEKPILNVLGKSGVDLNALKTLVRVDEKSGQLDINHIIDALMTSPTQRSSILAAGTDNVVEIANAYAKKNHVALPEYLTAGNMEAVVKAADAIGKTLKPYTAPENMAKLTVAQQAAARKDNEVTAATMNSVHAFVNVLLADKPGQAKAAAQLKPADITALLGNPATNAAIKAMLGSLTGLPEEKSRAIQVITEDKNWNAISALANDPRVGAPLVRDKLAAFFQGASEDNCKPMSTSDQFGIWLKSWDGMGKDNVLGENLDVLKAMNIELQTLNCGPQANIPRIQGAGPRLMVQ